MARRPSNKEMSKEVRKRGVLEKSRIYRLYREQIILDFDQSVWHEFNLHLVWTCSFFRLMLSGYAAQNMIKSVDESFERKTSIRKYLQRK